MTEKAERTAKQPTLSPDQRKQIAAALEARGATAPCPRCGNSKFFLLDGYFAHPLQRDLKSMHLGGPSIPVAIVACERCGFLAEHAVGVLGLLPKEVGE